MRVRGLSFSSRGVRHLVVVIVMEIGLLCNDEYRDVRLHFIGLDFNYEHCRCVGERERGGEGRNIESSRLE